MIDEIARNVARVQERIAAACRRAGRRPEEVRLVAVSKIVPPERIREAYDSGLRDFGENRVQEAEAKRPALTGLDPTWHLIGHLQTNKARTARELFGWIHSVDSLRLAEKLHRGADAHTAELAPLPVLIEVNIGGEGAKSGVEEGAALDLARGISALGSLALLGLMAVPPYSDDPEAARPYFSRLRRLGKVIDSARLPNVRMDELSMGMSHDFEVAIEEGATLVRIGTAIFGARP
ncbi:MAG TPA: YggS family pyridoxal phosphate-dependent enzyme [Terriglobia bacterium]|jgi:pyridoxal phosphate enzyme (YggS family)|nr:YggS family pyridoxal phosphate-dependent enzyme [Terriglobia bacterium]